MMIGLSLSLTQPRPHPQPEPLPPTAEDIICGAIDGFFQISVMRGNKAFVLAPHVIYWKSSRPDEFWLDAVVVAENGNAPAKAKLKSFEIADLENISVLDTAFQPLAGFQPTDPEYAGKARCIVQTV